MQIININESLQNRQDSQLHIPLLKILYAPSTLTISRGAQYDLLTTMIYCTNVCLAGSLLINTT